MPLFGIQYTHHYSLGWKQIARLPEVQPDNERTQKNVSDWPSCRNRGLQQSECSREDYCVDLSFNHGSWDFSNHQWVLHRYCQKLKKCTHIHPKCKSSRLTRGHKRGCFSYSSGLPKKDVSLRVLKSTAPPFPRLLYWKVCCHPS